VVSSLVSRRFIRALFPESSWMQCLLILERCELFSSFELDGSGLVRVSVGTFREVTAFDNSRRRPPFLIQVLCTEHHARLKQSPRRSSQYHPLWSQPENSSQPCKLLSPALQSFSQSLSIVLLLISSSNLRSPFSASGSERF